MTMCQLCIKIRVQFHRGGPPPRGLTLQVSFHLWETDPQTLNDLFSHEEKKNPALKCHILYTWRRTTTFTFTVREQFEYDSVTDVAAVESCELPLMEEKQRCNITWIFLQVFNQTKKMALSHSVLSSLFLSIRQNLSVCAYWNCSNNLSMIYWLVVLLLLNSFIKVACSIINKVTVLTASLSSVYSVYILENKIPVCCLFK